MTSLTIKNAQLMGYKNLVDISIEDARIVRIDDVKKDTTDQQFNAPKSISDDTIYDAKGNFVCSGFFESHIHLDKACILDRCSVEQGTLEEAIEETENAKENFTEDDVFERASTVIEMAIKKGTVGLRTFV